MEKSRRGGRFLHGYHYKQVLRMFRRDVSLSKHFSHERCVVSKIVALYALFSAVWIYTSDTLLSYFIHSQDLLTRLSIYKGMLFIVITAVLLYKLISRNFFRIADMNRQLGESEQRFEQIFDNVTDAIFIHDSATGKIVDVNQTMCRLYGFTREEARALGVGDVSLGSPPYSEAEAMGWMRRAEQGIPQIFEWCAKKKDETLFWAEVSMRYAVIGEDKRIIVLVRDITERRQKDESLRHSQELLQLQFSRMPVACIFWGNDYRVRSWNPAAEKIFGYSEQEVLGKTANEIIVPREAHVMIDGVWSRLMSGEPVVISVNENVTKNGRIILCEWTNSPLTGRDNTIMGVISMIQDITERQEREQEQLKMQKLESLGILAGGIAHDFNNILTAILGNISLVRMRMSEEDPWYRQLEEAESASYRAKDLTQQLLTFSKGGVPQKKTMALEQLVRDSAGFAVRGANVRCDFSFEADLMPVDIDEGQIGQVISNLVINACQAMPSGGDLRITAWNTDITGDSGIPVREGRYVAISIQDRGIGIPEENLSRIFDPYFTTKQKGSGLGLAITYSIIRNHDGHIGVKSQLGVGTTFTIYLPASDKQLPRDAGFRGDYVQGQGRILLMDDEEIVRTVTGEMLKAFGYEVAFAADGIEAIRLYTEAKETGAPFDAVIMDLTVPGGMGGKEAVLKLREIDPDVRAIVSSGYSQDPILADFRKYGFSEVLKKPFSGSLLSKVLHKVLTGQEPD
ncbi:MAG TPA: PAS domain S-box protein [Thermodesulfovibrionales bacterium]|nr:PAS domain S-box protein [Thermodesulfovibrionales bacterium]